MQAFDVIVLGAGVMGAGAAWNLARDGRRVLLLEQFEIGHSFGSSHGESRIIRRSYDDSTYIPLVEKSYALWREVEAATGQSLLEITGGLDLGLPDSEYLHACRKTMDAHRIPYEKLNATDLRSRFPQFQVSDDTIANYQPDAGVLRAGRCVRALVSLAERLGAVVRAKEPVHAIHPGTGSVEVTTAAGRYAAESLVIAGGSWNGPLGRMLGLNLPLKPLRQQKCYFAPASAGDHALYRPGRFPVWIWKIFGAVNQEMYGFPWLSGAPGIKVAHHDVDRPRDADNPDSLNRTVDPDYIERVRQFLAARIPGAAGRYLDGAVCIYTMTPDQDFILDCHPAHPRIVIGAGFSGTGFKFGTGVGRILADLATGAESSVDIARFRLARFGPSINTAGLSGATALA